MSTNSVRKFQQGYVDKFIPQTCSNCAKCVPVMGAVLVYKDPSRMAEGTHYVDKPVSQKCGVGNFSVKKQGRCNLWCTK